MRIFFALPLIAMTAACGYVSPDAGHEGVLVAKPWFFGSGGVLDEPVKTGSTVVAASTDAIMVDVTPQTFEVKFEDLMPSNGIPLDFDTTVRLQVTNSPTLVRDFRGGQTDDNGKPTHSWYWQNINPQYENFVRAAVKKYDMNQLALTGAAIDAVDAEVQANLIAYIKANKLPVKLLGVTVGRANPPAEIKNQRVETAAQTQRIQTMEAAKKAEDSRKAAELARAEADNAYRSQMSLSPEQFVDLQRIAMQKEVCAKADCTFIMGNGSPVLSAKR